MSTIHLAAKYRPQTFADVAGQEAVKAALSRAAATGAVAPAYLFSGTRGVGKTTIARVLAKALNCETAPTGEPCNQCRFCRQITAGALVDVVEMDAASHTGVDNVRQLKEDIGYAPMEARYKVFIIDEAHMLSKAAFNALLKTLEEPPPHATFIMASTEVEKFPATIISRCQHYLFKPLPQAGLVAHLENVLGREGVDFEPEALSLIARRGAGSVRDSMSLLSQAMTLTGQGEPLSAAGVRSVLGLAGREIFNGLLNAFEDGDCLAAGRVLKSVLEAGLDLGFFMRELALMFRGLFLLNQSGEAALDLLEMPRDEATALLPHARAMSLARIHASWQLVLEGQRRVQTSLEPAVALELLIYNLASLDALLPLGPGSAGSAARSGGSPGRGREAPAAPQQSGPTAPPPTSEPEPPRPPSQPAPPAPTPEPIKPVESVEPVADEPAGLHAVNDFPPSGDGPQTWEGFQAWAGELNKAAGGPKLPMLRGISGRLEAGELVLDCPSQFQKSQLETPDKHAALVQAAAAYFGRPLEIKVITSAPPPKSTAELREELKQHPAVQAVMNHFGVSDFSLVRHRHQAAAGPQPQAENGDE